MKKYITEMTRKEFDRVPFRKKSQDPVICNGIVILPGSGRKTKLHDSGFRCMDFVAVQANRPLCRLSGCSDVIHIDGIGGYAAQELLARQGMASRCVPTASVAWSIDCLAKSGLLYLWPDSGKMEAGEALSSFEIFAPRNPYR